MTREEAIKNIGRKAFECGFSVNPVGGYRVLEIVPKTDYIAITIVNNGIDDDISSQVLTGKITGSLYLRVTCRRMGGDGMSADELYDVSVDMQRASNLLRALKPEDLQYEVIPKK